MHNPHLHMSPDLATSAPYNFRNNVPFDRISRPQDLVENTILIAGTKYFKPNVGDPTHGRVAISHLAAVHQSGMMLISAKHRHPKWSRCA